MCLQRIQCECDIRRVLAGCVLVLQARREGQANQGLLPLLGQGALIAVAPVQDDSAELRHHA